MTTHPGRHDAFNIITATEARAGRVLRGQPPAFFTAQMENAWLGDTYRGASAFLVCGGPSARSFDLNRLASIPGIITMAVNNAAQGWRPQLWCGLDEPHRFLNSIWLDPGIQKFYPLAYQDMPLRDHPVRTPKDCPNTWFIRRNDKFDAKTWLHEDTINWGQEGDDSRRGGRSTMVAAMRILYILGFKRVYLVGADFKMEAGVGYSHDQVVDAAVAAKNNSLFEYLNGLFTALKPEFDAAGFEVFNTEQISGLTAFPYQAYVDARDRAAKDSKVNPRESSAGLYDGHFKEPEKPRIAPPIVTQDLRDLAWGYSAGLSVAEVKAAWDAYTAEIVASSNGKPTGRLAGLEDKALAAAGIPPRNGAWSIPATTRPLKMDTDKHDSSRRAFIVGNGSTADAGEGWHDDGMQSDDVIIRINFPRLEGYPVGDRTDYWVLNPQHPRALEDLEIGLALLKPWRVVLIQPRVLDYPMRGARYAEVLSRLRHISANKPDVWDPAYAKRLLQPPVVHETWGLSTGAEAIRWARTWADSIVTTGIDTHIAPKIEPKRIRYWGELTTGVYTPQERLYLRLLKQAGGFSDLEGFDLEPLDPPTAEEPKIPKRVHMVWVQDTPPRWVLDNVAKTRDLLAPQGWSLDLWSGSRVREIVTESYPPEAVDKIFGLPMMCQISDFARLAILLKHGGVYLDTDVFVIRDFNALRFIGSGAFATRHPLREDYRFCNGVIGAPPGDRVLEAVRDECLRRLDLPLQDPVRAARACFGPNALTAVVDSGIHGFTEIPYWYFHPVDHQDPRRFTLASPGNERERLEILMDLCWGFTDGVSPYATTTTWGFQGSSNAATR
jgi:hypothetical protein